MLVRAYITEVRSMVSLQRCLLVLAAGPLICCISIQESWSQQLATGHWEWSGKAGWQRMALDVKATNSGLAGTISMGPGKSAAESPDEYWQYFFAPRVFDVSEGRIVEDAVSFEQHLGDLTLRYLGFLDGDYMHLVREIERPWGLQRIAFTLHRDSAEYNLQPEVRPKSEPDRLNTSLDFLVLDVDDDPVTGLTADDFVVSHGGDLDDTPEIIEATAPWRILLMFDRNLILRNGIEWTDVFANPLASLVSSMDPEWQVAIAVFDSEIEILVPWQDAGNIQLETVESMDLHGDQFYPGGPDLYGSLASVVGGLSDDGRQAVIVVTDGRDRRLNNAWFDTKDDAWPDPLFPLADEGEFEAFDDALQAVGDSHTRLFFVAVGTDDPFRIGRHQFSGLFPQLDDVILDYQEFVRSRLLELASASNGALIDYPHWQGIREYSRVLETLALDSRYSIEFLPDGADARSIRTSDTALRVVIPTFTEHRESP